MAAMTLVMAVFASCSNDEMQLESTGDFKVNFTVADKAGFDGDTRAVKTGWENGDEILIAVQGEEDTWYESGAPYNCFKLKYNGSTWTTDMTGFDNTKALKTGNRYVAGYHPGTVTLGNRNSYRQYLHYYKGGECLSVVGTYPVTDDGIDLGKIELKRNTQDFQISVKNLAAAGKSNGTWKLYIEDAEGNKADNMFFKAAGNAFLYYDGFGAFTSSYSTGINYGGDVVFYFSNAGTNETSLKFKLTDDVDTYIYTTTTIPAGSKAYYLPAITDSKWTKQ